MADAQSQTTGGPPDPQYVLRQNGPVVTLVITYCDQSAAMKDMLGWRRSLNTGSLKRLIDEEVWRG
jgi:hypothetical protein